ncbi:MAG: glycoside hydrolase domain-containing protein, partial [Armatimonadota bacterium]
MSFGVRAAREPRIIAITHNAQNTLEGSQTMLELTTSWWVGAVVMIAVLAGDKVPYPWTALRLEGRELSCWNRHYEFKDELLPADIRSGSASLLRRPMRISATVNGVRQEWQPAAFDVNRAAPDVIDFTTVQESSILKTVCCWKLEFDGMLLGDLSVYPKTGQVTLSSLELIMPLNRTYAKLFHHHPVKTLYQQRWGTDPMNCGALPDGPMRLPFVHHIWLGNESCGLQWFAESDRGLNWSGPFITVDRNRTVTFRLAKNRVVSENEPFRFTFGLMASPVKPADPHDYVRWAFPGGGIGIYNHDYSGRPVDPKDSRLAQLHQKGVNCLNLWNSQDSMGDPMISNPELDALTAAAEDFGIAVCASTGVWIDERTRGYDSSWELRPRLDWFDDSVPGVIAHAMCQNSGWRTWFLNRCRRMMKTTGLRGFYLDGSGTPQICSNLEHGCGYKLGQETKGTLPILATRDLMKQLYLTTRAAGGRSFILAHTSSTIVLPCLSFADAYLDGEHICGYPEIDQPLNVYNNPTYTLSGFRAEMMGHQFGIPAFYLKYPKQGAEAEDVR